MKAKESFIYEKASIDAKLLKVKTALDLFSDFSNENSEIITIINEKLMDACSFIDRIEELKLT